MAAFRTVEDFSSDPRFIGYYDYKEAYEYDLYDSFTTGINRGIKQGISQGIEQAKIEMAKTMYKDKINLSTISKYSQIPENILNT